MGPPFRRFPFRPHSFRVKARSRVRAKNLLKRNARPRERRCLGYRKRCTECTFLLAASATEKGAVTAPFFWRPRLRKKAHPVRLFLLLMEKGAPGAPFLLAASGTEKKGVPGTPFSFAASATEKGLPGKPFSSAASATEKGTPSKPFSSAGAAARAVSARSRPSALSP